MISVCSRCGGLFSYVAYEIMAGRFCSCAKPDAGQHTIEFRKDAIDDMNRAAEVLSGDAEITRLKAKIVELTAALTLCLPHVKFFITCNPQHEEPHKAYKVACDALNL